MSVDAHEIAEKMPFKKRFRRARRAGRERFAARRQAAYERSPEWLKNTLFRGYDYLDMLLIDHGIFRILWTNRHQISDDVWRSNQPTPYQLGYIARRGVRTVVNLRGDRECGGYRLEKAACERLGLKLVNFSLKSRAAPEPEIFHEAKALFETLEYPILVHCKSGADRAGLAAVLLMHFKAGEPIAVATEQLSAKFGHFRKSDTGILDFVFERYMADNEREPMTFMRWVDEVYDGPALEAEFKTNSFWNLVVNKILRRE